MNSRHLCRLHVRNEVSRLKHLCSLLMTCSELDDLIIECQGEYSDFVLTLNDACVFHKLSV